VTWDERRDVEMEIKTKLTGDDDIADIIRDLLHLEQHGAWVDGSRPVWCKKYDVLGQGEMPIYAIIMLAWRDIALILASSFDVLSSDLKKSEY